MIITKKRVYQLFILAAITTLPYCVTDDYNLKNGVNTDMTLGGDSLSMPLGMSDSIFLSDMIDDKDSEVLKKDANGNYALSFVDSTKINIEAIKPVTVHIDQNDFNEQSIKIADFSWPSFNIDPISIDTKMSAPNIDFGEKKIDKIDQPFTLNYSPVFNAKGITKTKKDAAFHIGPFTVTEGENIFDQNLSFNFSTVDELKSLEEVFLKGETSDQNIVTLRIDRSSFYDKFSKLNDTIKNFYIAFPKEFKLNELTHDDHIKIENNTNGYSTFRITDKELGKNQKEFVAQFIISSVDVSNHNSDKKINMQNKIKYLLTYKCYGEADLITDIPSSIKVDCKIEAQPVVKDLAIKTNPIAIDEKVVEGFVDKTINNLPKDVSKINTIYLAKGASMNLSIENPGLDPFKLSNNGTCQIKLPEKFIYADGQGIIENGNERMLTLTSDNLWGNHNIEITGIKLSDVEIDNHNIQIKDKFVSTLSGLQLVEKTSPILLSSIQSGIDKEILIVATPTNFTVRDAAVKTNQLTFDIPSVKSVINVDKFISKDVQKIYNVTLSNPSDVKLNIKFNNIPTSLKNVKLQNYKINLPYYLSFNKTIPGFKEKEEYEWPTDSTLLIKSFTFDATNADGLIIPLSLTGFNFGDNGKNLAEGNLNISSNISLNGEAVVPGADLGSVNFGDISVKPSVSIENLQIRSIEGKVDPKIDPIDEKIKLDVPDALKDANNDLDIQNPVITLQIGNTMGIPVLVDLHLIPKRGGKTIPNSSITIPNLRINEAATLGQTTWTKFIICKSLITQVDEYKGIVAPNLDKLLKSSKDSTIPIDTLSNILRSIPDSIVVQATPRATGDHHKVDLSIQQNRIDLKYAINVPLEFGSKFKIQYNDTISDLHKDLEDILKLTRNIDITAAVDSKIPMNLSFKFCPLDSKNDSIKGIEFNSGPVNYTGIGEKQIVKLGIKETTAGALDKLDKVIIRVSGEKNNTALTMIPLRPNQYMIIELKVKLPNGITIKKDDF